jgi:hypothetical protein
MTWRGYGPLILWSPLALYRVLPDFEGEMNAHNRGMP